MDYAEQGFATADDGTRLFWGVLGDGPGMVLLDGIGCDGWAWNHIQPYFAPYVRGPLPRADRLWQEIVTLPLHIGMTDNDVATVIAAVGEFAHNVAPR